MYESDVDTVLVLCCGLKSGLFEDSLDCCSCYIKAIRFSSFQLYGLCSDNSSGILNFFF